MTHDFPSSLSSFAFTRRRFAALCCAALVTGLTAGCDKQATPAASTAAGAADKIPVGICELVEHEALDLSVKGFLDELAARGFKDGEKIAVDRQNAQGDQATLQNIGARFLSEKTQLIFAVSTPATQAMARATRDIPIVATAVTSFEAAKVVKTNEKPGTNVTGVSNIGPIARQLDLFLALTGNAKTVGVLFNAGEVNSAFQVEIFKKAAAAKGVEVLEATVSSVNDIQQAVTSLSGKVAGLWFPTDNVLAAGTSILAKAAKDAKIPTIPGDEALIRGGCLATIAVDYYTLGRMSGTMAADILEGKSKPADMAIQTQDAQKPLINLATAKAIGLTIPEDILKNAILKYDGTVVVVSHDREFLDGMVEKVYEFRDGGVKEYLGGIYYFLEKRKLESLQEIERRDTPAKGADKGAEPKAATAGKLSYEQKKEQEKLLRRLRKAVDAVETQLAGVERQIAEYDARFAAAATTYNEADYKAYNDLKAQYDHLMHEWEKASYELEITEEQYNG